MSTTKTLTVAQLLILTTAAQRPDHMVLPLPPTIRARGSAQRNLLGALLKLHLVAEVPVNAATIAWRTNEAGQQHGLRLTAAGLAAADASADAVTGSTNADVNTSTEAVLTSTGDGAARVKQPFAAHDTRYAPPGQAPRRGRRQRQRRQRRPQQWPP